MLKRMRMASSDVQRIFLVTLTIFSSNIPSATLTYSAGPQTAKTPRLLLPDFVNITHLALEFVLTCGSAHILCNPEAVPFEMPTNITGDCSPIRNCDTNCAMTRSCSPDVEYAFLNISCLSTVLYSPKKHYTHTYTYMMIASCNDLDSSTSSEYVELCQNMDEINEFSFFNETFRPVLSRVTGIVYRNKFCASCNADDNYLNPFKLEMKCDNFFDMNSFSSLQEIWGALNTFNCSVSYVPPFMTSHTVSKYYNSLLFAQRQCNTTGLWSKYDSQIEWACKNFNSYPYKGHSNVFCYICNPSLASTQDKTVIGTCNVTGEWDYRNPEVENACLHLPLADRTFPLKNKFCQICNVNSTGYRTFGNFSVFIEEAFGGYLNNFYYGKFERITDEVKADSMTTDMFEEPLTLNKILPSMKALQELGEFCGFANFCSNAYEPAPGFFNVCSFRCSPDKNCCDQLSSNYNLETLSVYDQCDSRKSHYFFTEMCENGSEDDIISVVTAMSSTTQRFHRNAYCARCSNDFGELNLAGFRVDCPKPLEVSLFMSFSDLQKVILRYDCNLTVKYPQSDCGANASSISNCRNRTHWIEHNSKILDICERQDFVNFNFGSVCYNGSLYRNIFCLICNRDWVESTDGVISECNVTGNWIEHNNVLEEMCLGQPYYPGWYPFKNIYCASCNPSSITIEELQNSHRFTISSESYITICTGFSCMLSNAPYRILFSLTDLNFPSDEGKDSLADEFCAEGKTLADGECRVVIEDTFHLGYNSTFGVRIINASHSHWLESDLLNISKNLFRQDALLRYVEILQINLNEIIEDKTNFALDNKTVPADECIENEWRVNAILFVAMTENRTEIEKTLMAMRETVLSIFLGGQELTVQTYPVFDQVECRHGLRNSGRSIAESATKHQYEYQIFNDTEIFNKGITFSTVNELLFCVLKEIDASFEGIIETLCKMNITFKLSTDLAKIYVCANSWEKVASNNSVKASPFTVIYGIFSIVCTLFSLSCLCLTFLTYVLFKSLRTVPGKNNMILAFSLFWAQLLLQFGLWQKSIEPLCVFLGIAIHYFWLTAFCAMNICSLHMFKVFHNPMMVSRGASKRTQLYYCLYIFIAPLVFISIFILVIFVQSDFKEVGYGRGICFLSHYIYIVIMFIIPACVIIVINAILCGIAYWYIRSSPRVDGSIDRNDFKIYLKLTTVTGTAWAFMFIDTLNPLSVFSYVAATTGALQGVYIFVAFICNKKVWTLYKDRLKRKSVEGQQTQQHTMSENKLLSSTVSSSWVRKQLESSKETFI